MCCAHTLSGATQSSVSFQHAGELTPNPINKEMNITSATEAAEVIST